MSKTSSEVKNRWNKKAYDMTAVRLPKGMKDRLVERYTNFGRVFKIHFHVLLIVHLLFLL